MRIYAALFATILALQSAWLLTAEALRPALPYFPQEATPTGNETAAAYAARIGWPRGELRVDNALADNAAFLAELMAGSARPSGGDNDSAQAAVALAPADARAWVLLAALGLQTASPQTLPQLKMSYYTLAYSDALFPARMQIAARAPPAADEELGGLVNDELMHWLRANPNQGRPIALAYRAASPAGRAFLAAMIGRISPSLLADLRRAYP